MMVYLPFPGVWAEKGEGRLLKFLTGKELMAKHKNIILYFIFGVVTTLVNIVAYYICARLLRLGMARSNIAAWIFAVAFAYLTNRKWVFESSAAEWRMVIREIAEFFLCRLATGGLDLALMYLGCERMQLNDLFVKCLSNGIVILVNYIASKVIIFKK